jgi:hypothetical protein
LVFTFRKNLLKLGFKPSEHVECVFYYGKTIFIVCIDDTILLGPDKQEIDTLVKRLGKTFKIEDQGDLSDYLGIKIERKPDGTKEWKNNYTTRQTGLCPQVGEELVWTKTSRKSLIFTFKEELTEVRNQTK